MLASILAWLGRRSAPSPQYGPCDAGGWYGSLRHNFNVFRGDPLSTARFALAEAHPEPTELPILITCHREVGIRVLAMVIAALTKDLDCEAALIAALRDENEVVRRTAAEALLRLNSVDGLAAVVSGNAHGRAVRTLAAHQLREHGPNAAPAIPALLTLINWTDINWRSHVAASCALAAIGQAAEPYLVHALHHGSPRLQYQSAMALKEASLGTQYKELIQQIIDAAHLDGYRGIR